MIRVDIDHTFKKKKNTIKLCIFSLGWDLSVVKSIDKLKVTVSELRTLKFNVIIKIVSTLLIKHSSYSSKFA